MPEPEIDPRALALERAYANPESRALVEKALKISHPHVNIPSLEFREAVEQQQKKAIETQEALEARIRKFEADRAHEDAVSGLTKQGYGPDDIKAIEKIMAEEGVGLHQNAAIVYDTRRNVGKPRTPAPEPRGSMSPRAYGRGQHAPYFNGIMDGEFHHPGEDWARSKVDMILQDFQTNRAEAEAKWGDQSYWPSDPNFPVKNG